MNNLGAQLWMVRTPYGLEPEAGTLGGCGCNQVGQVTKPASTSPVVAAFGGVAAGLFFGWFLFGSAR